MTSALVILSGGQDSTTVLFMAKHTFDRVYALTFDYAQRHRVEIEAARRVAALAKVERHEIVTVGQVLQGTSPLVNSQQKVEQYASAAVLPGGIEKTFVPMRNALFLTLAANRAVIWECDTIMTGVSNEDYGGYPDCRPAFIDAMRRMIEKALGESTAAPTISAPLMSLTKQQTVQLALKMPDCMEALAFSHTCYNGAVPPCGTCHACLLRQKGFDEAGVVDPLLKRLQQETV